MNQRRSGSVLIVVLVCLAAASTILLGLVSFSIRSRHQVRTELQLEQTGWLLDAGIGHTIQAFRENPDLETEELSVDGLSKSHTSVIQITRARQEDSRTIFHITARMTSKSKSGQTTQRSQQIAIPAEPTKTTNLSKK